MKIKILSLITLISFGNSIESKNSKSNAAQEETSEASKKGIIRKISDSIENDNVLLIVTIAALTGVPLGLANHKLLNTYYTEPGITALYADTNKRIADMTQRNLQSGVSAHNNAVEAFNLGVDKAIKGEKIIRRSKNMLHASNMLFGLSAGFLIPYFNHKLRKWYGIDDSKETSQNIDLTSNNQQTTEPLI